MLHTVQLAIVHMRKYQVCAVDVAKLLLLVSIILSTIETLVTTNKGNISTDATNGTPIQNTSDATLDDHINQRYEKGRVMPNQQLQQ